MKITFVFPAYALLDGTDDEVPTPQELDGQVLKDDESADFNLSQYFDFELAEAGIIGGSIRAIIQNSGAQIAVDYWSPPGVSDALLEKLSEDTLGQMSDGAGEDGFQVEAAGRKLLLRADWQTPDGVKLETTDDGRHVPPASPIAIAARQGDVDALRAAIQADPSGIDRLLMSWTGLHYAIMYGHVEAAEVLLRAGADPNRRDDSFQPETPLETCARSNSLSDDQSYQLAKLLIECGADCSQSGRAREKALLRNKVRTAELL